MTIRQELKLLGPDAVRRGMIAFEHRGLCKDGTRCCFLIHAIGRETWFGQRRGKNPGSVEVNFEEWNVLPEYAGGREVLRQDCITLLAEHGTTPEPAPRKRVLTAALVCVLLLCVL